MLHSYVKRTRHVCSVLLRYLEFDVEQVFVVVYVLFVINSSLMQVQATLRTSLIYAEKD